MSQPTRDQPLESREGPLGRVQPLTTKVLTQSDVRSLLDMERVVPAVEEAFAAHGRGETQMPVKVYLDLRRYDGDFRAMPAYLAGSAGVKWVNAHPHNPQRHGLPSVLGMYILSDPATARPLAVMDATYLTAVRTGAAAAVAARRLANPQPRSIGFVGCGVQARTMLAALRTVYEDFEVVGADRSERAARAFAEESGGRAGSLGEAAGCDIVCTATPSRAPVVLRDMIRPGTHINAMGADAHGKQELEAAILLDALVVVDDFEQAGASGEVNVPLEQGVLEPDGIHATLGAICARLKEARTDPDQITVFDSTGLAVQDVAIARVAYNLAVERGVGLDVDFQA